mmetsp:Transcript_99478/g.195399  ORF Transcript_99478/g.195399 Transcript_99478/m.195399 type:complete len:240 (-) Transcript_99478:55-774(-)
MRCYSIVMLSLWQAAYGVSAVSEGARGRQRSRRREDTSDELLDDLGIRRLMRRQERFDRLAADVQHAVRDAEADLHAEALDDGAVSDSPLQVASSPSPSLLESWDTRTLKEKPAKERKQKKGKGPMTTTTTTSALEGCRTGSWDTWGSCLVSDDSACGPGQQTRYRDECRDGRVESVTQQQGCTKECPTTTTTTPEPPETTEDLTMLLGSLKSTARRRWPSSMVVLRFTVVARTLWLLT